ncbi:ABC transporter substrate-binding protein [Bacillus horti]|uniref:Iron complex transport system substrate-binding protein n=1 Tax=Caldalkalibacillus horti TaxID=77523 RepID=A0ABT9VXT6_9BACI|nr:ABC transporter substrate-binding protein [Bacillus horti]MDQ0165779.1 iron complex transport system substrate-binding protein [Bacillus horti]
MVKFLKERKAVTISLCITLIMLLLVACGSNEEENLQETNAPSNMVTPGNSSETEESEEGASDEPGKSGFRSFDTIKGAVDIPENPLRIVTDYYGGELLSVGANVIGVESSTFKNPFLKDLLVNIEDVGVPINVEKTLELEPDLIVVMYDDHYEELSKIAPTLHIPYGTTTNIYETVEFFGELVGSPEIAQAFIDDFNQVAAEGRDKLQGIIPEDATFGLYELTDMGDLWIFGDNAGRGGQAVYNGLQYSMPHQHTDGEQTLQLSMEVLPEYAADYMFLTAYDPENKGEALEELQASMVWSGLDAIQNNTLFINDFDTFYRYDPIAIKGQIDLIVNMLIARHEENKN